MNPRPPSKAWLTRLRKLKTRKGREEENRFVAEGWKIVHECFGANLDCQGLLVSDLELESGELRELLASRDMAGDEVFSLPESQFGKAASTRSPQGILGVFTRPTPPSLDIFKRIEGIVVVLDEVRDPGNAGTAIRCAAGLGAEAIALTVGCADLWNPKTIRAGAGAIFRLPVVGSVESGKPRWRSNREWIRDVDRGRRWLAGWARSRIDRIDWRSFSATSPRARETSGKRSKGRGKWAFPLHVGSSR